MKKIIIIISSLLLLFNIFSEDLNNFITESISKTEIIIGENITINLKCLDLKNIKILWDDMIIGNPNIEILDKIYFYKGRFLYLSMIFSIYDEGVYPDCFFKIPLEKDGEVIYINTDIYNIEVNQFLTPEELENIKNLKDPSSIELKKEKKQEKIPFYYSFFLKIIFLTMSLILCGLFLYFLLYKYVLIKKNISELSPYEEFLANIESIYFDKNDTRKIIESKLSNISEIFKRLIYKEFDFKATSETTNELISSLKEKKFEDNLIKSISKLFSEIDLIKFAKADYDYYILQKILNEIKIISNDIHQHYLKTVNTEIKDVNI